MKTSGFLFAVAVIVAILAGLAFFGMGVTPDASAAPLFAPTPVAVQEISRSGLAPSYTAASTDGNTFTNDGYTFAHIKNTSGVTVTATFNVVKTELGLAISNLTVTMPPTTGDKMIGPFPQDFFNDSTGKAEVDWSAITDVTIAFVKMP